MRIEFKSSIPPVEVDVRRVRALPRVVSRVIGSPAMEEVLRSVAKGTWYSRYRTWDDMSGSTAKEIAAALFNDGREGALSTIQSLVDEYEEGAAQEFDRHMDSDCPDEVEAIVEAVSAHCDLDEEEVKEAVLGAVKERVVELMEELDESSEVDVIPSHVRVEVMHYFGLEGGYGVDDRYLSHESVVSGPGTVTPDERLLPLFEGLNVPFDDFVRWVRDEHGVDLRGGRSDEALVAWLAAEDYVGDRGAARERAEARADAWRSFSPSHDPSRPALLPPKDVWTVLSEATGGGVPCFVARVPLTQLVGHDFDKPARFDPTTCYAEKGGGFVGIYDPVNGSGYVERPSAPVDVPAGRDCWRVSGVTGYDFDRSFGIVGACYYVEMKEGPAPALEVDLSGAPVPAM